MRWRDRMLEYKQTTIRIIGLGMGISNTCHDDFLKPNLLHGRKVQEGEGLFVVFFWTFN